MQEMDTIRTGRKRGGPTDGQIYPLIKTRDAPKNKCTSEFLDKKKLDPSKEKQLL